MNEIQTIQGYPIADCTVEMGLLNVPYEKLSLDQLKNHATALNQQALKRDKERKEIKKMAIEQVENEFKTITNSAYDTLIEERRKVIQFRKDLVTKQLNLLHEDFKPILEEVSKDVEGFNIIPQFKEKDLSMSTEKMYDYAQKLVNDFIEEQSLKELEEDVEDIDIVINIPNQSLTMKKSEASNFIRILKRNKIRYNLC